MQDNINSEKFLVFLISTASSAVGLLLLSVFFKKIIILGNMQLSRAMAAVLLSFILNFLILATNKAISTLIVEESFKKQIIISFMIILATIIFYSTFVQVLGLKLLNLWGGVIIAFVITAIQFFISKYTFKILSKDF